MPVIVRPNRRQMRRARPSSMMSNESGVSTANARASRSPSPRVVARTNGPCLDHPRLRQHHQLGLTQTQFAAEDLGVVLADERGTAGNAPG